MAEVIEIEDDQDPNFISLLEAVEANALASASKNKRQKISSSSAAVSVTFVSDRGAAVEVEGSYAAALRGSRSALWQQQQQKKSKENYSSSFTIAGGGGGGGGGVGGGGCFKCGGSGHWARDCTTAAAAAAAAAAGGPGEDGSVPGKRCPCGSGPCLVRTSNTAKNPGRKFYRCPLREENGGCGFFEWCDNPSSGFAPPGRASTEVRCSSYSLPRSSEPSFISRQASFSLRAQTTYSNYSSSQSSGERTGSSCFKCGQEGHWTRDCTISSFSSNSCTDNGGSNLYSSTSGTGSGSGSCFKCGKSGHWARDCTISSFSANSSDSGGNCLHSGLGSGSGSGLGSGSCFKCGQSGHWARDCTGQEMSAVAFKRKASRSFQTPFANRCK